ncbi:DUF5103 domain-containing protein [Bacteroidales bacterium OttesenSCG-928-B11]|nr:DUF5103 domain-containing protein [Bacteroidales bacterium OttesenSCG-928-C03]MDL2311434.1 DUF5103 domain-containing protein [Bacteroidales bacterium OttesenSCG-928-B11]
MKNSALLVLFFCLIANVFSQLPGEVKYDNRVYVPGIESIKIRVTGTDFGQPIIKLGSSETLTLDFDDLLQESRYLKYTIIHCTHDWKKSDMNTLDYIAGFMDDEITEYSYSFNTIQHYLHYTLEFPNNNIKPIKSGNYLLYVFDGDMDNPVLTRRFMIIEEQQVGITGSVHAATNVTDMYTKQEIDFVVNPGMYNIRNPKMYMHATIMQNGRWDNAIMGLTYRSGTPGELSFDYDNNENVMNGGAEFRVFDIRSLRYNGTRVVSVAFKNRTNQIYLVEDAARPFGAYESNATLKGRCYYKNEDFSGTNTEDYAIVHFALRADFPFTDGDVYVFGELTDWHIKEEAKLVLNPVTNYWETQLFLKQGFYNYQYAYVKNGTNIIDETFIEGNHWQTHNDYTILIYLQDEGTIYDKLVGVKYLNIAQ